MTLNARTWTEREAFGSRTLKEAMRPKLFHVIVCMGASMAFAPACGSGDNEGSQQQITGGDAGLDAANNGDAADGESASPDGGDDAHVDGAWSPTK